jgi:hypothetical protein
MEEKLLRIIAALVLSFATWLLPFFAFVFTLGNFIDVGRIEFFIASYIISVLTIYFGAGENDYRQKR